MDGDGSGLENRRGESPLEFDPLTFRLWRGPGWIRNSIANAVGDFIALVGSSPTLSAILFQVMTPSAQIAPK